MDWYKQYESLTEEQTSKIRGVMRIRNLDFDPVALQSHFGRPLSVPERECEVHGGDHLCDECNHEIEFDNFIMVMQELYPQV